MDDFLKLILFPLYAIAQIWVESVDGKIWQKYIFWYILFLILVVGLVIYLL